MIDRPNSATVAELAERLARLLAQRPAGLITDIDGTISPIARSPGAATIAPWTREALARLSGRLDLVSVITGRSALDAGHMLAVPGVVIVGNHGLERLDLGGLEVFEPARPYVERVGEVLRRLEEGLAVPGLEVEHKGVTGSVHFRRAPDAEEARVAILRALEPLAARAGLRVTEGRKVIEVRPALAIDKGTALRDLVHAAKLRSVVMLGDDRTDVDAMEALSTLRLGGSVDGCSVGVLASETPPELLAAADVVIDGVTAVEALLTRLAHAIEPAGS